MAGEKSLGTLILNTGTLKKQIGEVNEMLKETGLRQDNLENNQNDCFIEKCQEFFNIKL